MTPPAPYTHIPKPGSPGWVNRVGALLRDGYGADDISIRLACDAALVRKQITLFREAEMLAKWFTKGSGNDKA
jgi:hypothetical protein